jgi:hypothetical protein
LRSAMKGVVADKARKSCSVKSTPAERAIAILHHATSQRERASEPRQQSAQISTAVCSPRHRARC